MPKELKSVKELIQLVKTPTGVQHVRVKVNRDNTKFKVRTRRYLYTCKVEDKKVAEDIRSVIPAKFIVDV